MRKIIPLELRFRSKVEKLSNGCHRWLGKLDTTGYGRIVTAGRGSKISSAHRVSYELNKGRIPAGYEVDHLCKNRWCVNPDHLEAVTKLENIKRSDWPSAVNKRKTHCKNGHVFDKLNTIKNKEGSRACKICREQKTLRYWSKVESV